MANTYLTRTQSMGNRTTFTFSAWVKRSSLGEQNLITVGTSGTSRTQFHFQGQDALQFYNNDGGSVNMYIKTNRLFRDLSAWYHIVLRFDTTQSTASDRIRFYVNGEEETSLATNTIPSEDADNTQFNYNGIVADIGRRHYDATGYFDGSMSHVHFCDGQSYDASAFGSTDSTTGEWKINTSPSVTYGTNGFFILKDGNSVTDQSGEGNNFTVGGGTLTNTEDNPSNVFNVLNPLHRGNELGLATFSNGNTKHEGTSAGASYSYSNSTLASSSKKYYAEFKRVQGDTMMGISDGKANAWPGSGTNDYVMYQGGEVFNNGSSETWGGALSNNDILGVAMDLDNNAVYWSKNGVWQNSGDPTSGASRTGGKQITAPSSTFSGVYHFMCGKGGSAWTSIQANFGNGYFGTTAVASAGTNASGNGIFEYDVPTGYTALSTKGLNL
jgi:hypothetical protein